MPENATKPIKSELKPIAAETPANPDQKAKETQTQANNSNPSASPEKPSKNVPVENDEHGATKQDQKSQRKMASLRKAEILSILYKHAACMGGKKAKMKKAIKAAGVLKVANLVLKLRG